MGGYGVRQFTWRRRLFHADLVAQITVLDEGVHALLTGGECSHVGAVALAWNGELLSCPSFPGHKEQVICERWALALSRELGGCATAACGIHYDNAAPEQIKAVLSVSDELLQTALTELKKER